MERELNIIIDSNELTHELRVNQQKKIFELKIEYIHSGLTFGEPLVFEKILRDCYSYPKRKHYVDIVRDTK